MVQDYVHWQDLLVSIYLHYRRLARWRLVIIGDHAGDAFRVTNLYRVGSGLRAGSSGASICLHPAQSVVRLTGFKVLLMLEDKSAL